MKSLLNDLSANAGKTAYQTYTIEHGIERISVKVPLKNAKMFEQEFSDAQTTNKEALMEIVKRYNGTAGSSK